MYPTEGVADRYPLAKGVHSQHPRGSVWRMSFDFSDEVRNELHEQYAQGLAETAREEGLDSADDIEIDADGVLAIDIAWVRERANEILRGE